MPQSIRTSSRVTVREFHHVDNLREFASAVSLHAHTHHSWEVMSDLPRYITQIPGLGPRFEREVARHGEESGEALDFSKGWWHPPVSPQDVFESEAEQARRTCGLEALVSVTDHDSITAGLELQSLYAARRAPISVEWTVPYLGGFFHLGVHNLPPARAGAWFERLYACSTVPGRESLDAVFADLHADPGILVVFNHPQWDLACVGERRHQVALRRFLMDHGASLHALELNGYRTWTENLAVVPLAEVTGLPLIAGGDRHGRAPNALLNLSRASSFAEFVDEVRLGISHVVVMPDYRRHTVVRKLESAGDVLRTYPGYRGRSHWTDRVSCQAEGVTLPLSQHWPDGGPLWVRGIVRAARILTSRPARPAVYAGVRLLERMRHRRKAELRLPPAVALEIER